MVKAGRVDLDMDDALRKLVVRAGVEICLCFESATKAQER